MMKKVLVPLLVFLGFESSIYAYQINGMHATLLDCNYEQVGYQMGYVGYYRGSDNKIYTVFFGNNYCEY